MLIIFTKELIFLMKNVVIAKNVLAKSYVNRLV
jgi:hypothetical protein